METDLIANCCKNHPANGWKPEFLRWSPQMPSCKLKRCHLWGEDLGILEQCGGFGGAGLGAAEASWISHHSRNPPLPSKGTTGSPGHGAFAAFWALFPLGNSCAMSRVLGTHLHRAGEQVLTQLPWNSHSVYQFKTRKSSSLLALVFWIGRRVWFERHHWTDTYIDLYIYT